MKNRSASSRSTSMLPQTTKAQKSTDVLDDIHQKIRNSAALNGGFDTLLLKIDKIEHSQGQMNTKVDKIHEAIFDPNEGVFAKLADYKIENSQKFSEISQHMSEVNEWKKYREKSDDKKEDFIDASDEKIKNLENNVSNLTKSKETAWGIIKWFAVAIGGGLVTLLFGWLQKKIQTGH